MHRWIHTQIYTPSVTPHESFLLPLNTKSYRVLLAPQDYYFYMASNGVSSTGFNVEIGGYSRAYMSSEITFPDMVYLDRVSSFSFSIYIACSSAKHLSVEEKPRGGSREWAHVH